MSDLTIDGVPIAKLKVVELKNQLEDRGLSKAGKKDELIARLTSYMEIEEKENSGKEDKEEEADVEKEEQKSQEEEKSKSEELKKEEDRLKAELAAKAEEDRLKEELKSKQKEDEELKLRKKEEEELKLKQQEEEELKLKQKEEEELKLKQKEEEELKLKQKEKEELKLKQIEEQKKLEAEQKRKEQDKKDEQLRIQQETRELERKRIEDQLKQETEKLEEEKKVKESREKDKLAKEREKEERKKEKQREEDNQRREKEKLREEEDKRRKEREREREEERRKDNMRAEEEKKRKESEREERKREKRREEEESNRKEKERKEKAEDRKREKRREEEEKLKEREKKENEEKKMEKQKEEAEIKRKEKEMKAIEELRRQEEGEKPNTTGVSKDEQFPDAGEEDNKDIPEFSSNKTKVDENGVTSKADYTLELDTAADDTLVMEVDQNDMVPEDPAKDDKIISAEPGQVTSLRKLGGSRSSAETEKGKRGWGATRTNRMNSSEDVEISSNSLKDLVPDLKPLLSTEAVMEEEHEEVQTIDSDADVAGPKIPEKVKKESGEPAKKRKKIQLEDVTETEVILINYLTRPFTVNQLKEMLKRTGTIEDFWIDRIKSKCCVKFSSVDQASETRMALDGVTWPQGSPRQLKVSFSSDKEMTSFKESVNEVAGRLGGDSSGRMGGVREWDRNKLDQEREKEKERDRERERDRDKDRDRVKREVKVDKDMEKEKENEEGKSEERKQSSKCLEDLFSKTAAIPSIYWKPLSDEEQKKKEEERNKKVMEAQIMREMMDTKESLQRSKRLVPERRRSRSSSGSSR